MNLNSIRNNFHAILGIFLLAATVAAAAALYFDVPLRAANKVSPWTEPAYACPMHPEIVSSVAGDCSKCGMALRAKGAPAGEHEACANQKPQEGGCCSKKGATAQPAQLPFGHPPVEGYVVATNKGGCQH